MYVKLTNKSVTYVSGTFVTLDTGLNSCPVVWAVLGA